MAYELFTKEENSIFLDGKPSQEAINKAISSNKKIYLNTEKFSRFEIDKIFSSSQKIHLIVSDESFNRWNIGRMISKGKNRVLVISKKWGSWDVRSIAQQRGFIVIDGTRFDHWNLSKIMEAGAYVIVDHDHMDKHELKQLLLSHNHSKLILYFPDKDNEYIEAFKELGFLVAIEGQLTRLNLNTSKRASETPLKPPPSKPQPGIDEMVTDWLDSVNK